MNKTEAVRSALRFEPNGPVPYSVNLTAEAYEAYGKALIEDFGTEQVKQDFGAGRLNLREAATLAIDTSAGIPRGGYAPRAPRHDRQRQL